MNMKFLLLWIVIKLLKAHSAVEVTRGWNPPGHSEGMILSGD